MRFHCTALAAALLLVAGSSAAQTAQPLAPATGAAVFQVYLRGTEVGRENVNVARGNSGWIITSSGSLAAPVDFTINRFEATYAPDWQPLELALDANTHNAVIAIKTSFTLTTAINEVSQNNQTVSKEDQISARTVVLVNNVFGSYEALAARLSTTKAGDDVPVYVAPQGEVKVSVNHVTSASLSGPTGSIATRRYEVTFQNPQKPLNGIVTIDDRLRLVRLELPDAGVLVVRNDAASVSMRSEIARNPTDVNVSIPANGFQLAGTVTTPPQVEGRLRHPAIVLIGGTAAGDRDEVIAHVPVFAELARALADSGQIVLRYDRRGTGQSGGRIESATLDDYADDAIEAVKWLGSRDDVDRRHIVVCGRGQDGAAIALIAASREKSIDGVVTVDGSGEKGADLILERQRRALADLNLTDAERQSRIALQRQIDDAVLSGAGWSGVPDSVRRQADTPWFKSQLAFDPAGILPKVRQPILILQADLDAEIPAAQADRLGQLAKQRKKSRAAEIVHMPGVNQALVTPPGSTISPKIADAIADWIKKL